MNYPNLTQSRIFTFEFRDTGIGVLEVSIGGAPVNNSNPTEVVMMEGPGPDIADMNPPVPAGANISFC